MTTECPLVASGFLASVQPVVLVGGRSRRFGRDKLREPWGAEGRVLVEYPINALRRVFGRRVRLIGACDPSIESLGDGVISDIHPGIGPIGGIVSGLVGWSGPIFVLAGDMPAFSASAVLALLFDAERHPTAQAVLASTDRVHPCAGIYTQSARAALDACISRKSYALLTALDPAVTRSVELDAEAAINVNYSTDVPL